MKTVLQSEEAAKFIGAYLASLALGFSWWVFFAWLLAPDFSAVGYLVNTRVGAAVYNFFHHQAVAIAVGFTGIYLASAELQFAGVLLFGHSSMDRMLGYGLKFTDDFRHTHLGWIGKVKG